MKTATIKEIKEELATEKPASLLAICLRLARFKKENKELLTYLLFESHDEQSFVTGIKNELDETFQTIKMSHLYFVKKSLRSMLKLINKYCRYSGIPETEAELRLHFCFLIKKTPAKIRRDKVVNNLYQSQVNKIRTILKSMHEDLAFDFERVLQALEQHENEAF